MSTLRAPPPITVRPAPNACCLTATINHTKHNLPIDNLTHHLFSHFPDPIPDINDPNHWDIRANENRIQDLNPFCYAVKCFVSQYELGDPQPFEQVFKTYHDPNSTLEDIVVAVRAIQDMNSVPARVLQENTRECLGQIAIQDERVDVVEWCLQEDGGLRFEADFQITANKVTAERNPELYAVLDKYCFTSGAWNHHWRNPTANHYELD
ncbi:hypothetical protein BKA64DRAFT_686850 [Cadophora sp. MPI-SDFR-AT-0126]|nr:hypothetical protein BKA64DRAFT_686850 [Leotiomycetes sp. MPI-SDFR-AT-0126]